MSSKKVGEPQNTLIIRDKDLDGNVLAERTIIAHSMEEAFALSNVKQIKLDGHACKEVVRTEKGIDAKTFCNIELTVELGEEGTAEGVRLMDEFIARGKIPLNCWKCKDRVPHA